MKKNLESTKSALILLNVSQQIVVKKFISFVGKPLVSWLWCSYDSDIFAGSSAESPPVEHEPAQKGRFYTRAHLL